MSIERTPEDTLRTRQFLHRTEAATDGWAPSHDPEGDGYMKPSDPSAYRCATYGCDSPVERVRVHHLPTGGFAFYGECREHDTRGPLNR